MRGNVRFLLEHHDPPPVPGRERVRRRQPDKAGADNGDVRSAHHGRNRTGSAPLRKP